MTDCVNRQRVKRSCAERYTYECQRHRETDGASHPAGGHGGNDKDTVNTGAIFVQVVVVKRRKIFPTQGDRIFRKFTELLLLVGAFVFRVCSLLDNR